MREDFERAFAGCLITPQRREVEFGLDGKPHFTVVAQLAAMHCSLDRVERLRGKAAVQPQACLHDVTEQPADHSPASRGPATAETAAATADTTTETATPETTATHAAEAAPAMGRPALRGAAGRGEQEGTDPCQDRDDERAERQPDDTTDQRARRGGATQAAEQTAKHGSGNEHHHDQDRQQVQQVRDLTAARGRLGFGQRLPLDETDERIHASAHTVVEIPPAGVAR